MNKILSFQSGWVFIFVKTYWASNDINHVGLHFRKALCLYFALEPRIKCFGNIYYGLHFVNYLFYIHLSSKFDNFGSNNCCFGKKIIGVLNIRIIELDGKNLDRFPVGDIVQHALFTKNSNHVHYIKLFWKYL